MSIRCKDVVISCSVSYCNAFYYSGTLYLCYRPQVNPSSRPFLGSKGKSIRHRKFRPRLLRGLAPYKREPNNAYTSDMCSLCKRACRQGADSSPIWVGKS
jgi:hypothetical protein